MYKVSVKKTITLSCWKFFLLEKEHNGYTKSYFHADSENVSVTKHPKQHKSYLFYVTFLGALFIQFKVH